MKNVIERPFYNDPDIAVWYDTIIDRFSTTKIAFIVDEFERRAVAPPATILDAGCGTGSYAIALAEHGYAVDGVDLSSSMIEQAIRKARTLARAPSFRAGNIAALPADGRYDAILCRGVLNDMIDAHARQHVFASFAGALRPGGAVLVDVRDWDQTAKRKAEEPIFEKSVDTAEGRLTFRSETSLAPVQRRLLVHETYRVMRGNREHVMSYDFVMQCWTKEELMSSMADAHFTHLEFFRGLGNEIVSEPSDRIVVAATKKL